MSRPVLEPHLRKSVSLKLTPYVVEQFESLGLDFRSDFDSWLMCQIENSRKDRAKDVSRLPLIDRVKKLEDSVMKIEHEEKQRKLRGFK